LKVSINKRNEDWLSNRIFKIYPETGKTIKKISMPETLCVIDKNAGNGSFILNKLI
jgi:glutamine cyclotransferase